MGNMVGAWRDGGVLDFVDLGFWPVFNVADAGIVLGLGMALWWIR
jgi:signal peptidase II